MKQVMDVRVVSSTLVKPSILVDRQSTIPLSMFDEIQPNVFISVLIAFKPPNPSNQTIISALAHVLDYYPHFTGKFSNSELGKHCIIIDHDLGVPVVETKVDADLAEYLPLEPSLELEPLYPNMRNQDRTFSIKLNHFSCGSIAIGLACHHQVCDGQSMNLFLTNWARVIRGLTNLDPYPIFDRTLLAPRDPPQVEFPHENFEFGHLDRVPELVDPNSITNLMVHFSDEFIGKLKFEAGAVDTTKQHTRFECIAGHLWRKVNEARGLDEHEPSTMIVPVNGRARLMQQLPSGYFGNIVLCALPASTLNELRQGGLSHAAKLIKAAIRDTSKDYFQSFIDFCASHEAEELVPFSSMGMNCYSPDLEITSWLGFEFHKMDIGGGELCAFIPSFIPVEGIIILIPSPSKEKGGVNVHVTMLKQHAELFKKIAHTI